MHVFAENWKAKCIACGKEVTYPNWKCEKLPRHHKVAEQTYFHLGGGHIQHPRERRGWSPQVILKAGSEATDTRTGEKYLVSTIRVVFAGQQVTTQDPEVQFYLETKNDNSIAWGEEGKARWDAIYLTPDQRAEVARKQLAAVHKELDDANTLLAQTKARVAGKAGAVA
jgi:hypothetical protein